MMRNNGTLIKFIPWAYLLLATLSVRRYLVYNPLEFDGTVLAFENIGIFWVTSVYPIYTLKLHKTIGRNKEYVFFNKFMIYTFCLCLYSLIVNFPLSNGYEKMFLFNYWMAVLSGLSVFYLSIPCNFTKATKILYKCLPFMAIIYFPWTEKMWIGDMVGFLLMPISLPLLFWKNLSYNKKILYGILAIYVVMTSYWGDARSHVIKYGLALLIGLLIIRFDSIILRCKNFVWCIFAIPFVLFWLGLSGRFNVFESAEDIDVSNLQENTLVDTRTLLYTEALASAVQNNYILCGRGIGRGYSSNWWRSMQDVTRKSNKGFLYGERNSETAIVNIFTWGGALYVLIYSIMMASVVFYGLYRSFNKYVRAVALYLSFYYVYCWVENFQGMTIDYFYSWFIIAICLSPRFRRMNDGEFISFVKKTF